MCDFNPKNDSRFIDPCMEYLLEDLNSLGIKTYASCCGHGKYNMTIIAKTQDGKKFYDLMSRKIIPRKKRFYKRDKQGVYHIPEVIRR